MSRMQLFCLTFAGGNASFYDDLEKKIGNSIEMLKIEYSGHGRRHREPFYHSFDELADDIYPLIKERISAEGLSYAIMGYSMGSIAASVILKKIIGEEEIELPRHLFLAAHEPMSRHEMEGISDNEVDEYVKRRTIQFGDVSDELLYNSTFWKVYLPIYRADYGMISRFHFEDLKENVSVPTTVFYSETDTPYSVMNGWKRFYPNIEFIDYEGSHFFIKEHIEEMSEVIRNRLEKK